jgi:tetratricopeptide (TPR) repeat protein
LSDIELWRALVKQTRESWQRAKLLVNDGKGLLDGSWSMQLDKWDKQIKADEQDWHWAKKLDLVRANLGGLVEGKYVTWIQKHEYSEIFQALNLDLTKGDLGRTVEQIKGSPLRYALVAALDDWAIILPPSSSLLAPVLAVSRRSDPDSWRSHVRDANNWIDTRILEQLAATVQVEKQTPQILSLLAFKLNARNHPEQAVKLLRKALKAHPRDFWLHIVLGMLVTDPAEKVGCLTAALAVRPDSVSAHNDLGVALFQKKDLDGALQCFHLANKLDAKFPGAIYNLGMVAESRGDLSGAIQHYKETIALDPDFAAAYIHLGAILYAKGDLGGAEKHYYKAIALAPQLAAPYTNLGIILYAKGDLDGAIQHHQKTISLDPKSAKAHNNLGTALAAKKDLAGAIRHYQIAIAFNPNYADPHYSLGNTLKSNGDLAGAIKHYQKAISLNPNYVKAHNNLGSALAAKKDLTGAIKHYQKAIALDPNYAHAHCSLGLALYPQGKFSAALASLKKGHELGSKQLSWTFPSAKWIKDAERLLELEQQLPAILQGKVFPTNSAEQFELAHLCYYTNHHVSAARFFAAALAKEPKLHGAYRYRAACAAVLAATGQSKDADKLAKDEPAKLRQQALSWLRAELGARKQLLVTDPKQAIPVRYQLKLWQYDPDLTSVREEKELAKLTEAERKEWQALWAEVGELVNAGKK